MACSLYTDSSAKLATQAYYLLHQDECPYIFKIICFIFKISNMTVANKACMIIIDSASKRIVYYLNIASQPRHKYMHLYSMIVRSDY